MSEVKKIKEEELKLIIEQQKNLNDLLMKAGVLDFQKSKIIFTRLDEFWRSF